MSQTLKHTPTQRHERKRVDWHPADVKAALEKRGARSLRQISIDNGYPVEVCARTLRWPAPEIEKLIADELGMKPQKIWPSRYDSKGVSLYSPLRGPGKRTRRLKHQARVLKDFGGALRRRPK